MNDERLARRAAAGDEAAFEAIFRRYHQDLYRYCLATVGNPQDAQDALQNTMVKAMQALPGERREIKLKPWLYRVARNEAIETLRKRRDSVELDAEREAANWEIAESTATRERLRQLLGDLEELPERQRSALVMRELAGLDFGEIGAAFGTSPAVVRQTLYEARLSLRQMDEGREMSCETVMRALSDADGRVTRRRDLRAHLRGCASCRAFRDGIAERRGEFAAIAPLPLAFSAGLLQGLLGGHASGGATGLAAGSAASVGGPAGAGGLAGTIGTGAGKVVATSAIVKSAATVAVVATVGVTAADRGDVIDLPLTGGDDTAARQDHRQPASGTDAQGGSPPDQAGSAATEVDASSRKARSKGKAAAGSRHGAKGAKGRAGRRGKSPRSPGAKHARGHGRGQAGRGKPRSKSEGRSQGGPAPSSGGQGRAARRKPPQAASTPGPSGQSPGRAAPAPQAEPPPKAETAPAVPSAPGTAPTPPAAKGGGESRGAGGAPLVEATEP